MRSLLIMAALWTAGWQAAAAAAEPIAKNPFTRPGYTADRPLPAAPGVEVEDFREIELKATLISGRRSFANLNGEILAPGEEFRGYRLLRVSEGQAVLSRDGETLTLRVRDPDKDESSE